VGCDILILAAFHPELAALRAAAKLGDAMRARIGGKDVAARVVGIGLPVAAAGAAMQLVEMQPRAVVLVGTCGAYPGRGVAAGEVIAARRLRLVAPSVVLGLAEFPDPMSLVIEADGALLSALLGAGAGAGGAGAPRAADVATTLAVTVDDGAAARIAQHHAVDVEHLEAHGVAAACAARGIPFGAALGVANTVGARARQEWRARHRAAAAEAADVVLRALPQIAPP
jgi:nucleoside phosphorylase